MGNQDWNSMNDKEFELLLQNSLVEQPPENVVKSVTPWKRIVDYVLIGVILNLFTYPFGGLNYIVSFAGAVFFLLGFRALKKENGWFKSCWIVSIVAVIYSLVILVMQATIYHYMLDDTVLDFSLLTLNFVSLFFCLFAFEKGVKSMQGNTSSAERTGGIVFLVIWYILEIMLRTLENSGVIVSILMIVAYIYVILSIISLSEDLEKAGYALRPASVRVSDKTMGKILVSVFVGILLVGVVCGYLFFNSYPMEWSKQEISEDVKLEEIKENLIELGFPEHILADLTEEDLRACEGARQVVSKTEDFYLGPGKIYYEAIHESDTEEIRLTSIAVEVPEEEKTWKVFHHFQWIVDLEFYGTESIELFPSYGERNASCGWQSSGKITGQVLYSKDGVSYTAPYYSMEWDETVWTLAFSFPRNGENNRGYVSYLIAGEGHFISSYMAYTHQLDWKHYPIVTAEENIYDSDNFSDCFMWLQFSPAYED